MTKSEIEEKALRACAHNLCEHCEANGDCNEKCEELEGMINGYILACKDYKVVTDEK